jgi:lysophospholipase L1-like esterase
VKRLLLPAAVAGILLLPGGTATATFAPKWTGTWATALTTASLGNTNGSLTGFANQSIRMIVRTSVGGEKLRIRLSNAYGAQPITIGHATVGVPVAKGSPTLKPESLRELTFGGSAAVTVYKGADVLSDPAEFDVPALSELAVTLYLPTATGQTSWHWVSRETTYVYGGDQAGNVDGAASTNTYGSFYFLAGIDVASRSARGSVVVLGDSISDGFGSTLNANTRWPDALANRIAGTAPHIGDPGVLNESLSGNRVTHDGSEIGFTALGVSGLARLDPDVFGQTGLRSVIVELGINDVQLSGDASERVIAGLRQLAAQLREHDVRLLVCTLGPFEGYPSWTPEKEATRVAINDFIRGGHEFDYVIDMDRVLRDPAAPTKLRPEYDSGDHIHPNDTGAAALAAAVPLWML